MDYKYIPYVHTCTYIWKSTVILVSLSFTVFKNVNRSLNIFDKWPVLIGRLETLSEFEPDLILISDSLDISLAEATKKIRMLRFHSQRFWFN